MQHVIRVLAAVTSVALLLISSAAAASPAASPAAHVAAPVTADVELDPTAYALAGHSLHVGLGVGRWRVDLGNFALALPGFAHADDGFDVRFDGFGAKLQYFVAGPGRGWLVGVDAALVRVEAHHRASALSTSQRQLNLGVNLGYRVALPARFYVTPWIGVSYGVGADAIELGGGTYQPTAVQIFPAVHAGYSFR